MAAAADSLLDISSFPFILPPSRVPPDMQSKKLNLPDQGIDNLIRQLRSQKVILDSDLARVYGVPTFRFQ